MGVLSKEYVSDSDGESDTQVEHVFRAPSNYKKCKHLKKFHKSAGEEVWLIKVPAGLDVGSLKSLPMHLDSRNTTGSDNSAASLESDAKKYSVTEQNGLDHSNLTLLVPDEDRESLRLTSSESNGKNKNKNKRKGFALDRVFTISEIANIPEINFEKWRVPRKDVSKVDGLKMRHFPTGYDEKDYRAQEDGLQHGSKKKRKEPQQSAPVSPSKKKHKKEKKEKKDKK